MSAPRLVIVYRKTQLDELLARHSTLGAVEFFLSSRGQQLGPVQAADVAQQRALDVIVGQAPADWRQAIVERAQLSRFLFEPDDLVVVVGQDGLVPNVSKYLAGQRLVGVSPGAPGVLCRFAPDDVQAVLSGAKGQAVEPRSMVKAELDDGQTLTALNEVFVGDKGHQSARYVLEVAGEAELQSSSGVIVGTGTGATGWLASLWAQVRPSFALPGPGSSDLAYFVREAWPSATTGTKYVAGLIAAGEQVALRAQSSLVVFGDGIESDRLRVEWGQRLTLSVLPNQLNLLRP